MATSLTPPTVRDELRSLLDAPGPFVSAYLRAPSATSDAEDRLAIEWHNARRALSEAGAPASLLARLDGPATADHTPGRVHCLIAGGAADGEGRVLLDHWMDEDLTSSFARFGPLPHLVPLLDAHRRHVPHVIVLIDRVGADITSSGTETTTEVEGETQDIARSAPGGWSQRRFQQRAENTWEDNARAVAGEVAELARSIDAEFVAVAGDVRASAFLVEHLPEDLAALTVAVDGSRHDHAGVSDEVDRIAADHAARRSVTVLHDLDERLATERGTADAAGVVQALRRHQVDVLIVSTGAAADDRQQAAYVLDSDRSQVALDHDHLVDPDHEAVRADLDDAAVAAAIITGAEVAVVPATSRLADGLGAILRF